VVGTAPGLCQSGDEWVLIPQRQFFMIMMTKDSEWRINF